MPKKKPVKKAPKTEKTQYDCPECGQSWSYSAMDLSFAEKDRCCHECCAGVEDYPANEGG